MKLEKQDLETQIEYLKTHMTNDETNSDYTHGGEESTKDAPFDVLTVKSNDRNPKSIDDVYATFCPFEYEFQDMFIMPSKLSHDMDSCPSSKFEDILPIDHNDITSTTSILNPSKESKIDKSKSKRKSRLEAKQTSKTKQNTDTNQEMPNYASMSIQELRVCILNGSFQLNLIENCA